MAGAWPLLLALCVAGGLHIARAATELRICLVQNPGFANCTPGADPSSFSGVDVELIRSVGLGLGWREALETDNITAFTEEYAYTLVCTKLRVPAVVSILANSTNTSECALGAGAFTATSARVQAGVRFSWPYLHSSLGVMVASESQSVSYDRWAFLRPFSAGIWLSIILTVVLTPIVISVFENLIQTGRIPVGMSLLNEWRHAIHTMILCCFNLTTLEVLSLPCQLMVISFAFTNLIMVASYTANLAAVLTAAAVQGGIQTLNDLVNKVVAAHAVYQERLLKNERLRAIPLSWGGEPFFLDVKRALSNGSLDAYIFDRHILQYWIAQDAQDCNVNLLSDTNVEPFDYGVAFHWTLPEDLVRNFSLGVLTQQSTGQLVLNEERFLTGSLPVCGAGQGNDYNGVLQFAQVSGLYIILGAAAALGLVASVYSVWWFHVYNPRRQKKLAAQQEAALFAKFQQEQAELDAVDRDDPDDPGYPSGTPGGGPGDLDPDLDPKLAAAHQSMSLARSQEGGSRHTPSAYSRNGSMQRHTGGAPGGGAAIAAGAMVGALYNGLVDDGMCHVQEWVPEPQSGGFYQNGVYETSHLAEHPREEDEHVAALEDMRSGPSGRSRGSLTHRLNAGAASVPQVGSGGGSAGEAGEEQQPRTSLRTPSGRAVAGGAARVTGRLSAGARGLLQSMRDSAFASSSRTQASVELSYADSSQPPASATALAGASSGAAGGAAAAAGGLTTGTEGEGATTTDAERPSNGRGSRRKSHAMSVAHVARFASAAKNLAKKVFVVEGSEDDPPVALPHLPHHVASLPRGGSGYMGDPSLPATAGMGAFERVVAMATAGSQRTTGTAQLVKVTSRTTFIQSKRRNSGMNAAAAAAALLNSNGELYVGPNGEPLGYGAGGGGAAYGHTGSQRVRRSSQGQQPGHLQHSDSRVSQYYHHADSRTSFGHMDSSRMLLQQQTSMGGVSQPVSGDRRRTSFQQAVSSIGRDGASMVGVVSGDGRQLSLPRSTASGMWGAALGAAGGGNAMLYAQMSGSIDRQGSGGYYGGMGGAGGVPIPDPRISSPSGYHTQGLSGSYEAGDEGGGLGSGLRMYAVRGSNSGHFNSAQHHQRTGSASLSVTAAPSLSHPAQPSPHQGGPAQPGSAGAVGGPGVSEASGQPQHHLPHGFHGPSLGGMPVSESKQDSSGERLTTPSLSLNPASQQQPPPAVSSGEGGAVALNASFAPGSERSGSAGGAVLDRAGSLGPGSSGTGVPVMSGSTSLRRAPTRRSSVGSMLPVMEAGGLFEGGDRDEVDAMRGVEHRRSSRRTLSRRASTTSLVPVSELPPGAGMALAVGLGPDGLPVDDGAAFMPAAPRAPKSRRGSGLQMLLQVALTGRAESHVAASAAAVLSPNTVRRLSNTGALMAAASGQLPLQGLQSAASRRLSDAFLNDLSPGFDAGL